MQASKQCTRRWHPSGQHVPEGNQEVGDTRHAAIAKALRDPILRMCTDAHTRSTPFFSSVHFFLSFFRFFKPDRLNLQAAFVVRFVCFDPSSSSFYSRMGCIGRNGGRKNRAHQACQRGPAPAKKQRGLGRPHVIKRCTTTTTTTTLPPIIPKSTSLSK